MFRQPGLGFFAAEGGGFLHESVGAVRSRRRKTVLFCPTPPLCGGGYEFALAYERPTNRSYSA